MRLPPPSTLNPARCCRAGMNPEVLLAAKLGWVLLVCTGFLARAGRQGAAVLAALEPLGAVSGWLLPAAFLVSGAALLTNQMTRAAAGIAGASVVLTMLGSLAAWRAHEWLCGAVLVLASLDTPGGRPWLLRAQATLALAVVVLDRPGNIDWTSRATLEGWEVGADTYSLLGALRAMGPAWLPELVAGWLMPATGLIAAAGLWLPRMRAPAAWAAALWLILAYMLTGTDESAWYGLGVLVAMLGFLEWPRQSLAAHWPRACGWPMWLRIALDHYDIDQQTEWPFPNNPDADLDVWVDGRHLVGRRAVGALLLYFPLFHASVFALAVVLLVILPQPWAMAGHGVLAGAALGFFWRGGGGSDR